MQAFLYEQPVSAMATTRDLPFDAGNGGLGLGTARLNYHVLLTVPLGPLGQFCRQKHRVFGLLLYNFLILSPSLTHSSRMVVCEDLRL